MSKDQKINIWYCVAKTTVVTIASGLPGGNRGSNGPFNSIGGFGNWWSSSEGGTDGAWDRTLDYDSGDANRFIYNKPNGFSVRCLRD